MIHEHLRFFRDHEDTPRALGLDPDFQVLARFLESDIQEDARLCRQLLGRISPVGPDHAPPIEFVGNSFAASFGTDDVILKGNTDGNPYTAVLEPHQVELALKGWLEFIEP